MKISFSSPIKGIAPLLIFSVFGLTACGNKENNGTAELIPSLPVVEEVQKDTVLQTDYVADIQAEQNVITKTEFELYATKVSATKAKIEEALSAQTSA